MLGVECKSLKLTKTTLTEGFTQENIKINSNIFQDFVRVVSHFRPIKKNPLKNKLNSRMEKLHFAFRMYDLDGDDKISKVGLPTVLILRWRNI